MKKILLAILVAVMLVALPVLAACGTTTTTTASVAVSTTQPQTTTTVESTTTTGAPKTLTIGAIAFLTGPAAAGGAAAKAGWELAVAKYNDAGGLKVGNDTYMIDLKVEDDAMSLDQATTACHKLIEQDGAKYIIGPLVDAFKTTLYPICQDAGVMLACVDTCNASAAIKYEGNTDVSPDKPLQIRCHWANDEITPYLLDYLIKNYPDAKKIAVCGVAESTTEEMNKWLEGELLIKGLEEAGTLEQIPPDTSDYNPPVTRMLANNPDAIFVNVSTPVMWGFVTKAARELGFKGPIFCATHLDVGFTDTIAGGGSTDIFGVGVTLKDMGKLTQDVVDARAAYAAKGYKAEDEISDVYLVGYNGLWVLLQAIEKAGTVDPAEVAKAYATFTNLGDLKTLWGDAYVGGLKTTGVNVVLNEPYWIDKCMNGTPTNDQLIDMVTVP